jgi:hypothetical protein
VAVAVAVSGSGNLVVAQQQGDIRFSTDTPNVRQIRQQTLDCIPTEPPGMIRDGVRLAARAAVNGRTYYWFYAYRSPDSMPEFKPSTTEAQERQGKPDNLIISVANGQCQRELYDLVGDHRPLTEIPNRNGDTLSLQVVRQLALDRYKRTIARIGRARLQQRVNRWGTGEGQQQFYIYPYERWALEQLGISIPERIINQGE